MIRIIKGVYGYMTETGIVRPKTEKDGPFTLTPEQEERLVNLGVAAYVVQDEPAEDENARDVPEVEAEKPLDEMTTKELRAFGKEQYGLTFKVGMTKAEMIEAIQEKESQEAGDEPAEDEETEEEDANGEEPPTFDPAEAVK